MEAMIHRLCSALMSALMIMIPSNMSDNRLPETKVRRPQHAGQFYDSDPATLRKAVEGYLAPYRGDASNADVAALIVPHAGYYYSGRVAGAGYAMLGSERAYKRVFLLGPSHYEWLDGASVNVADDFYATPLGRMPVDHGVGRALLAADSVFCYREEAHDREHCLEVQLPFLQCCMSHTPAIVPVIISTNRYDKLRRIADALRPYLTPDNLFVVSSDFSHYPSYVDAYTVDGLTCKALMTADVELFIEALEQNARSGVRRLDTSACGEYAIITLLMMLDGRYRINHLLYQNSGDVEGADRSRVVGYHAFAVTRTETFSLTENEKRSLKNIALRSIETALDGKDYEPKEVTPAMRSRCGVFVTLKRKGQLRGCIGHFGEETPLYRLVAEMARAAAFEDPRFRRLRQSELHDLEIEISVLTPKRRIHSIDEFELHRHGLYIRKGYQSGTFLPQVADEVDWTKEEFVGHCSRDKAGLGWDGWRDAELYVYEAIVF